MDRSEALRIVSDPEQFYIPTTYQKKLHLSNDNIIVMTGANRSGKSLWGVIQVLSTALGFNPFLEEFKPRVRVPNYGWVVSQTHAQAKSALVGHSKKRIGADDINLRFAHMEKWTANIEEIIGHKIIKDTNKAEHLFYMTNGSVIEFKSSASTTGESKADQFGGAEIDYCLMDEISPMDVYTQIHMRLASRNAPLWMTYTALEGAGSWTTEAIWDKRGEPSKELNWRGNPLYYHDKINKILICNPTIYDNRNPITGRFNNPPERIRLLERTLSENQKKIVLYGEIVMHEGLVFSESYIPEHHLIPVPEDWPNDEPPASWKRGRGVDFGFAAAHPYVCIWVAQSPDDKFYVYREYVGIRKTVRVNTMAVLGKSLGEEIESTMVDGQGGNQIDATWEAGMACDKGTRDPQSRIEIVENCFLTERLFIIEGKCPNLEKNLAKFAWEKPGGRRIPANKPRKIHDDSIDALGEILLDMAKWDAPEETRKTKVLTTREYQREQVWEIWDEQHREEREEAQARQELDRERWEQEKELQAQDESIRRAMKIMGYE